MKVLVTGANGFIGKNLCVNLKEQEQYDILEVNRNTSEKSFLSYLSKADFVFHLAGINRPEDESEFPPSRETSLQKISFLYFASKDSFLSQTVRL